MMKFTLLVHNSMFSTGEVVQPVNKHISALRKVFILKTVGKLV